VAEAGFRQQRKHHRARGSTSLCRAASAGSTFFGLIAVIGAFCFECPPFGIIGWPAIVLLAIAAIFCIASVLLIPVAYAIY
jgi:hypothetical protein